MGDVETVDGLRLNDRGLLRDKAFVDGRWCAAQDGGSFAVDNPADGSVVGHVADLGRGETQAAIEAAARAFPSWRAKTAKERAAVLRAW